MDVLDIVKSSRLFLLEGACRPWEGKLAKNWINGQIRVRILPMKGDLRPWAFLLGDVRATLTKKVWSCTSIFRNLSISSLRNREILKFYSVVRGVGPV